MLHCRSSIFELFPPFDVAALGGIITNPPLPGFGTNLTQILNMANFRFFFSVLWFFKNRKLSKDCLRARPSP